MMLSIGLAAVVWSAVRSYRKGWVKPADIAVVPLGHIREGPLRVVHAHQWWLAIRAVERVMDSLRRDSSGARVYDSILRARPGLMDSLGHAEHFFYLQDQLNK